MNTQHHAPRTTHSRTPWCRVIALIVLVLALCPIQARAQQGRSDADAPVTVRAYSNQPRGYIGSSIPFNIEFSGVNSISPIDLNGMVDGLRIDYRANAQSHTSQIEIRNGRRVEVRTASTTLQYTITPLRAGRFTIPAIEFEHEGTILRTNLVVIEAVASIQRPDIRATLEVDRDAIFVGQPVTASLHIDAVPDILSLPTILSPTTIPNALLFPLPIDKISADPTSVPARRAMEQPVHITTNSTRQPAIADFLGQDAYLKRSQIEMAEAPAFRWTLRVVIVPTRSGTLTIEPITVRTEVAGATRRDVFNRPMTSSEPVVLQTEPIELRIRPVPHDPSPLAAEPWERQTDLPIVGRFSIEARANPTEANVGDPIDLGITITGWEPLDRIGRFDPKRVEGFERRFRTVSDSISSERGDTSLIFTTQIRAADENATRIPSIAFRSFDPIDETWRTVQSEPVPLVIRPTRVVRAGDVVSTDTPSTANAVLATSNNASLGTITVTPSILDRQAFTFQGVIGSPAIIAAMSIPPTACMGTALFLIAARRRHARTRSLSPHAAASKALSSLNVIPLGTPPREAAEGISGLLRQFMADQGLNSGTQTPASIKPTLDACDAIRFGGASQISTDELLNFARAALRQVMNT